MLMMTTVTWGMSTLDKKFASDGTAIISSLRTIAGAVGSALFVSVMSTASGGQAVASIFGMRISFAGVTLLSFFILILAVWKIEKSPQHT